MSSFAPICNYLWTPIYRTAHIIPSYIRIDLASLILKKVSNMKSSFQWFHDVAGLTTATPDTTTHTSSTSESSLDHEATLHVRRVGAEKVSNYIWFLVFSNSRSNSDAGNCSIKSNEQITITRPGSATCKKMECLMTFCQVKLNVKW
jgi:hypothetical protein